MEHLISRFFDELKVRRANHEELAVGVGEVGVP